MPRSAATAVPPGNPETARQAALSAGECAARQSRPDSLEPQLSSNWHVSTQGDEQSFFEIYLEFNE